MADLKTYLGAAEKETTYKATAGIGPFKTQLATLKFVQVEDNLLVVKCTLNQEKLKALLPKDVAEQVPSRDVFAEIEKAADELKVMVTGFNSFKLTCEEEPDKLHLRHAKDSYPKLTVVPRNTSTVFEHSGGDFWYRLLPNVKLSPISDDD
jgi:hypothetical protein